MWKELDEFSRRVAFQVFKNFPQWSDLGRVAEEDGEKAFVLEVLPPSGELAHPLRIDSFGEEVTVAFDAYHAHFFEFEGLKNDDALSFVLQLISDEYAIISYWRDEQCCGSVILRKEYFPSNNNEYPYANKIRIRSWSGAHNIDVPCVSRD